MIGQTVSHYKILEKLGEGGMGIVYKAEDLTLTRTVALKFLPTGLDAQPTKRARFLDEARAAALLNHPHICTIYDFAEHDGQQFIVMEYVEGKTLREKIEGGIGGQGSGVRFADAIPYAIQIAEALREAHTHGIVHRDIKSDNIMVNSKSQVKVMDFGLAKLKGSLRITRTSGPLGTPTYMSPEQIQGGEVDARSDIFSFGIVFYEMLTGHLPFRGEHESAMAYSIVKDEPEPLQHYLAGASSELLHVIGRALEKNPEDRYQTIQDMLIDLRRLNKESVEASPPLDAPVTGTFAAVPAVGRKRSWKRMLPVSVLVLAVLCVLSIVLLLPRTTTLRLNPNRTSNTLRVPFKEILLHSISSDGKWVAFPAKDEHGKYDVYFMNTAGGKASRITDENAFRIEFADISPDQSQIVYDYMGNESGRDGQLEVWKLKLVSSQGGGSRTLADTGGLPHWRPDGQRIGYARKWPPRHGRIEIWSIKPDGTDNRLEVRDTVSTIGYAYFCWSPDGGSIAWVRTYPEGYSELFVRELAAGRERQLTSDRKMIGPVVWATNGAILFMSNRSGQSNLWMIPAGGSEPLPVTQGSVAIAWQAISADSKTLVYLQFEVICHLWISGVDGSSPRQLTRDDGLVYQPRISPDGNHIAYALRDVDFSNEEAHLYVVDRDGKDQRQLTSGRITIGLCRWSPDGKCLAYSSRALGQPAESTKVYLIRPFNPGPPQLLCKETWWLEWADSERFVVYRGGKTLLYSINGGATTQVYQDSTFAVPIDGNKRLVVYDFRKGRRGCWVVSIDGLGRQIGEARNMVASGAVKAPLDWRFLIYRKQGDELWRVWTSSGKEELIGRVPLYQDICDVSMDGKEILWLREDVRSKLVVVRNVFE